MTPAKMVAAFRKELGLSQRKLGVLLGLHQTAVSRIESGEQELRLTEYMKLQDIARGAGSLAANVILASLNFKASIKHRKSA